ncbi:DNA glycosylase [Aulographum hederae CBS 113979]|uniref:Endonuclease III homolog n=1 Tax=Aulographum hederae CBS 113979 TaxID=1176131 RepID=A0A6G1GQK6_9PEZI|nr:DNA glycosylase [Aulographum hederae CBS 113979]
MRTSRISKDTARAFKTASSPEGVFKSNPRRSLRNFAFNAGPATPSSTADSIKNEDPSESDSELSSIASDSEDTEFTSEATSTRKRKRTITSPHFVPSSSTIKTESSTTTTTATTPKKPRRKPAQKSTLPDDSTATTPPPHWQQQYALALEMRKLHIAPVDTMGCERLADEKCSARDRRFQTLVSLMLSSQTKDTVTAAAVRGMMVGLPGGLNIDSILAVAPETLNSLIAKVGFHNLKTKYIKQTAIILRDSHNSDVPASLPALLALPGVGPKMAYLCLSAAWDLTLGIGVDVHVHRITNLWGWHVTKTPEETRKALESWLPRERWREINGMLVGLGQTVCLPVGRRCGVCRLAEEGVCPASSVKGKVVKREVKEEEGEGVAVVKKEVRDEVVFGKDEDADEDAKVKVQGGQEGNLEAEIPSGDIEDIGLRLPAAKVKDVSRTKRSKSKR